MTETVEPSEFIEEDFIGAIERHLEKYVYSQWMTISRISQSSERHLGYDGVLTAALPFYIQFKRSTLYRNSYAGKLATDRTAKIGPENFFYGFELHKNARTGLFEQHNALHALSAQFPCAYVAPLFHRTRHLSDYKTKKPRHPWHYHQAIIHDAPSAVVYRARMFDMTVAIAPHKFIPNPDPSHYYTYNRKREVCFHSTPEPLDPTAKSFATFLSGVINDFEMAEQPPRLEELIGAVTSLYPQDASQALTRYVRLHAPRAESWEAIYELPATIQLAIIEDLLWQDLRVRQYVVHGLAA